MQIFIVSNITSSKRNYWVVLTDLNFELLLVSYFRRFFFPRKYQTTKCSCTVKKCLSFKKIPKQYRWEQEPAAQGSMKDIDHKYKSNLKKIVIITFTVHRSLPPFAEHQTDPMREHLWVVTSKQRGLVINKWPPGRVELLAEFNTCIKGTTTVESCQNGGDRRRGEKSLGFWGRGLIALGCCKAL